MFVPDQRVTIPNPDGDGRIAVRFLEVATDQPAEVSDPRVVGGKRMVDQAWIAYDDSTTALVPCFQIQADG